MAIPQGEPTGTFPQPYPLARLVLAELSRRQIPPRAVDWICILPAMSRISAEIQTGLLATFPRSDTLPLQPFLRLAARHCAFAGLLRALLLDERSCMLWLEESSSAWSYVLLASHLTVGRYNLFPQARVLPPAILGPAAGKADSVAGFWLAQQHRPADTPCISVLLESEYEHVGPTPVAGTQAPSASPAVEPSKVQPLAGILRDLLSSLEHNAATYGLLWSPLPGDHLQVLALERA